MRWTVDIPRAARPELNDLRKLLAVEETSGPRRDRFHLTRWIEPSEQVAAFELPERFTLTTVGKLKISVTYSDVTGFLPERFSLVPLRENHETEGKPE